MNRCLTPKSSTPRFFLKVPGLVLLGAFVLSFNLAQAQAGVRQFPANAQRGMLVVTNPPELLINGKAARLSPGARIKGANNLLVLSSTLVGQSVLVNYRRDGQGLIHEAWILSPEEAAQERSGMETVINFIFGSDADKPTVDDGKTPFDQLPKFPRQ
ncbi:MAG: hypothetical protein ACYC4S_14770 [Rhodoferax sp.]